MLTLHFRHFFTILLHVQPSGKVKGWAVCMCHGSSSAAMIEVQLGFNVAFKPGITSTGTTCVTLGTFFRVQPDLASRLFVFLLM